MNPAPTDIKEHVVCSKRCTLHKNTGDGIHRNFFFFYKRVLINVIINATGSDILWKCTACLLELSWISYSCPRLSFSLNFHSEILSFYTFPVKNSIKKIFYISFGRCLAKSRDFTLFILWPRVCSGKCQESRTVWCKAKNPQLAISHLRKSQQGNSESRKNRLQPLLQKEKNVRKTTNKQTKMWKNPNLSDSQNKNGVNS